MSNAYGADLQNIADEMTGILERRIGELLGHVQAAREVTRKLVQADEEIAKLEAGRVRLDGVLASAKSDQSPDTVAMRRRRDQVQARLERLRAQRGRLTDTLKDLKSKLDA